MAISSTSPKYEAEIGGETRPLVLRNQEIERFEAQYDVGIYQLWDQLCGNGPQPQARHVRDLIALSLVGGGMSDRKADEIVSGLPPSENLRLIGVAQRALAVAFIPSLLEEADKKKEDGSPLKRESDPSDMTSPQSSETSAV